MKIRLITVGKIKDNELKSKIEDYSNRIVRYNKFESIEVKDSNKKEEGKRILELADNYFKIAMEVTGKQFSSEEFAQTIKKHIDNNQDICFIIGGAEGLSEQVIDKADLKISLSNMTFTHEMARLFLTEQLYRSFTILKGESYHK